jgi:hypothetical protein
MVLNKIGIYSILKYPYFINRLRLLLYIASCKDFFIPLAFVSGGEIFTEEILSVMLKILFLYNLPMRNQE